LTTVVVPEGVDSKAVCVFVLEKYHMEIGNGLGELLGKVWRVGLMGYNSRKEVALLVVSALKDALEQQGWKASA
jgi:alanine-glyoxylate transaminase/serine-glyoxylate transaminase/serine-pyruvate transaminase